MFLASCYYPELNPRPVASAAISPGVKLAERVGFEPKFRREAKSLENAHLVDG
jgi:hypothetical protein